MSNPPARPDRFTAIALGISLCAYAAARVLELTPSLFPHTALVALDVLSAAVFALVHGARHYRLRGILIFVGICVVVGNFTENLGVATGFPFGRYYFGTLMGPKLFHVPILLGLAYIGMAYVSWMLARLILGDGPGQASNRSLFALPLVASFVMVIWDLAQDPLWATVLQGWYWLDGGPWFGVPISNYLGWFANIFLIYTLFALYLRRYPVPALPAGRGLWHLVPVFYLVCAAGNVIQTLSREVPAIVHDASGKPWSGSDITAASALVSIFGMGAFAVIAWVRLAERTTDATG